MRGTKPAVSTLTSQICLGWLSSPLALIYRNAKLFKRSEVLFQRIGRGAAVCNDAVCNYFSCIRLVFIRNLPCGINSLELGLVTNRYRGVSRGREAVLLHPPDFV